MSPKLLRNSIIYVIITIAVIAMFFAVFQPSTRSEELPISQVVQMAKDGDLRSIEIRGDDLFITGIGGRNFTSRKEADSSLVETLEAADVNIAESGLEVNIRGSSGLGSFFGLLLNFLPLIFFGGLLLFMMRQAQGFRLPDHELRP